MSRIDYCNSVMVGLPASLPCLLSNGSRMLQLGLFLASIDNPTSLLLYNNFIGYQWNSGSSSKSLRSCATFSTTVPLVPQRSRHFLLQRSSTSLTKVNPCEVRRSACRGKNAKKIKADRPLTRDTLNAPWLLTNRQFQWTGNGHSQLPLAELGKLSPNIDLLRTISSNGTDGRYQTYYRPCYAVNN